MRFLNVLAIVVLVVPNVRAQSPTDETVREEIRTLIRSFNAAAAKRDVAALQRLYTEDFLFIHGRGYSFDRDEQIDEVVTDPKPRAMPLAFVDPPNTLEVKGDIAILRVPGGQARGADSALFSTQIFVKRDGRWLMRQAQSTRMLAMPPAISVPPSALDSYVGGYDRGGGVVTSIRRDGDALYVHHPGLPRRRLIPTGDGQFVDKLGGAWTFAKEPSGNVTHFMLRGNGQQGEGSRGTKLE